MATLTESMELLKVILAQGCTPEDQRRYHIEFMAYDQVLRGDPYNESPYCHANERYIYRETRARAELQQKIHGNGGK